MRLLVVSPDYQSHALPLIQIAAAWAERGGEVAVATGTATRSSVADAGLEWRELRLGRGSNNGVIEVAGQPAGEDSHLQAFFDATRAGPVATLEYQADARAQDLLHEPDRVLDRMEAILAEVQPDRVLVDHVAFGARLALHALGVEPATAVLGHPSALVAPGEIYGLPSAWPIGLQPALDELSRLGERCRQSMAELEAASNELIVRRAPGRSMVGDLSSVPGRPTIYVYPEELHDPNRVLPADHLFVGSLVRDESLGDFDLPVGDGPRVTVALGSFLSARDDVLSAAVDAARRGGWRLSLAHGSTPSDQLPDPPTGARIVRSLPQVALLQHTDVMIHHGGNGSITESAAAGVPMVVLPFSTDQFAGAAAVERAGIGEVLSPNALDSIDLVAAVERVLGAEYQDRSRKLAASIARAGGAGSAAAAIEQRGRGVRPVGGRSATR